MIKQKNKICIIAVNITNILNSPFTIIAHQKYIAAARRSNENYDFSTVKFFIGHDEIEETLYQFLKENEILKENTEGGNIIFSDAKSVLVLKENFQEVYAERYYQFLHGNTNNNVIKHKEISNEIIMVTAFNADMYYPFITKFASYDWTTIESLLCIKSIEEPNKIHAFYYAEKLFISYHHQDQKIPYVNSFPIQNSDELKFYISAFCDQFNINRKKVEVKISGKIDENYQENVLNQYFSKVFYQRNPSEVANNPAILPVILI